MRFFSPSLLQRVVGVRYLCKTCTSHVYRTYPTHVVPKIDENQPVVYGWFYSYSPLAEEVLPSLRLRMLEAWGGELGIRGRIYIGGEGVNGQVSVPLDVRDEFAQILEGGFLPPLPKMRARYGDVLDKGDAMFNKLHVRIKKLIVADGINANLDPEMAGTEVPPARWNEEMEKGGGDVVIIDTRNLYESDVGHFEGAVPLPIQSFRDATRAIDDLLGFDPAQPDKAKPVSKVLMYCTGGIRCVKLASWMCQERGWDKDKVIRLEGGINEYGNSVKRGEIKSKYLGKNFCFDKRRSNESMRITDDVLAQCHQCGAPFDTHKNCANDLCHRLFIQCPSCSEKHEGTCSDTCLSMARMEDSERRMLGKFLARENKWEEFGLPDPKSGREGHVWPRQEQQQQQ